ncbi:MULTISPECIES: hypothetical protein [Aliarcobacter]|jgi:hypothetical protein|uniref:hypothetical protein n=1 Tax=Aliarcobacter TaxID=2321111 RepID=UPI0021B39CFD|nr:MULTISPECIES: hypothetical protein [Aliarcobacter]MCT7433508.1 hypothetical protein [Aliarcobacter cryaerophilus]MCT7531324.1 hypothetical protein [Aliarcobacter cryaerophilus]MCT7540233.1 hypothetical protein [Aliarcobacter cryaerophilus]MCT7633025.1 hypothetical protein [Aliarcobacter butzleri]MCT7646699.1 hypothetical protein [Aliarcobacter butzleri]
MIKIELDEKDVFKIMVGSMEDRINLLISESVMKEIDLKTIKEIVENEIDRAKKNNEFDKDKVLELIKLFQFLAYNRTKSKYSEEIATYLFDKLFEIISCELYS